MTQRRNAYLGRALAGELEERRGYLAVVERRNSGEDAGDFNSGAWRTRALNVSLGNTLGATVIGLPTVGLERGIYEVRASAPAHQVDAHQCRLYDVTNAAVLLTGTTELAPAGILTTTRSVVVGRIYLEDDAEVELQHRCETTRATDGMGEGAAWGYEVYAELELRRVK